MWLYYSDSQSDFKWALFKYSELCFHKSYSVVICVTPLLVYETYKLVRYITPSSTFFPYSAVGIRRQTNNTPPEWLL